MTEPTLRRRRFVTAGGALVACTAVQAPIVRAQPAKLRVGMMLPSTGTYSPLGAAITNGFRMAIEELGGKAGGRVRRPGSHGVGSRNARVSRSATWRNSSPAWATSRSS